ncbi:MAG TPA: hypothetical protein VLL05_07175 [Terriglobales bacterium]|nr:hypothetical protein [Terriglobales bacterium]
MKSTSQRRGLEKERLGQEKVRWDQEIAWVAALATFVSVVAFLICYRNGGVLLYGDAVAHINIARRVFDSRTPGLLQLGTVWLPLPHLLMMPLVASNWMWQSGVGGSLPSMAAYVFGVAGIFRLVRDALSGSGRSPVSASATAGFAAAIYGLNPNLLYLQSTAMTEALYLALFLWAVVYFAEFVRALPAGGGVDAASVDMDASGGRGRPPLHRHFFFTGQSQRSLWKCGLCLAGACFTRYDGWFLAAFLAATVVWVGLGSGGVGSIRTVVLFVLLAAVAPVLWFAYNALVYRNALEFANGPYSAQAIEKRTAVPGFPPHPGTHNLPMAGLYFLKSAEFSVAEGNWQRVWILIGLVGAGFVVTQRGLRPLLLVWLPVPFYMLSVAYGGVPIFTPAWWPFSLYNIRYGIQLLPGLAVFVALAVSYCVALAKVPAARWAIGAVGVLLVVSSYAGVWRAQPGCYREAWVNSRTRLQLERSLADQLTKLPPSATLLMYLGEHVGALQDAGIPLKRTINEGNHRAWRQPDDPEGLWERALSDPAKLADFAVAFEGDPVWNAMHARGLPALTIIAVNGQHRATIFQTRKFSTETW